MTEQKRESIVLEVISALLFLIFLVPFLIVIINSSKDAFTVTQAPMAFPADWGQLFRNIADIWTSPNVQYQSSFISSVIVTVLSLVVIVIFSSQAAWVLVRTKSPASRFFFMLFVAAMVVFTTLPSPLMVKRSLPYRAGAGCMSGMWRTEPRNGLTRLKVVGLAY